MTTLREQQIAWLDHIRDSTGFDLSNIATAAGLAPSTLTRFVNHDNFGHTLTAKTVRRIESRFHMPAYETRTPPPPHAFLEREAAPFVIDQADDNPLMVAIARVAKASNSIDLWILKTDSLAAVGYPAGMVVAVDRDVTPQTGDAVCAQLVDYKRGSAETIFRVFRKPYLLSAFVNGEPLAPETVNDDTVKIAGVIIAGFRFP